MGLRIFRRVKIAPGITLNVSKSGLSTSIGPRGAKVTLGHGRVRRTVGLPGTGVFYTTTAELDSGKRVEPDSTGRRRPGGLRRWIVGGAVALIALTWVGSLGGGSGTPSPSLPAQQANAFVAASPQPNAATTPTASATPKATATATPKPTAKPSPKPTAK